MRKLTRRDFLRLAALTPAGLSLSSVLKDTSANTNSLNIIILIFDSLSAANMSLYGYPRKTTPNIEKFAENSLIFHSHYSAGSYTTPGSASLLTGLYPWTHRAIRFDSAILPRFVKNNIFHEMSSAYNRIAFTQNLLAEIHLDSFHQDIENHLSPAAFSVVHYMLGDKLRNDPLEGNRALDLFLLAGDPPQSLLLGTAEKLISQYDASHLIDADLYPFGIPNANDGRVRFVLSDVLEGLDATLAGLKEPFIAYLHLYPPHWPYAPRKEYANLFNDNWSPGAKPWHDLGDHTSEKDLIADRVLYDRYVANVDSDFGKFHEALQKTGLLDRSYLFLTSDHGELFERGVSGHVSPLLYEAGIRVPLVVSAPGQGTRQDVDSVTNSVDILPTVLSLTGHDVPAWAEGELIPALGGEDIPSRSTYSFDAKNSSKFGDLPIFTMALRKDRYKLIYYQGYKDYKDYKPNKKENKYEVGTFELYDIQSDPDELDDLADSEPTIAKSMLDELLLKYHSVNRPVH